VAVALAAVAAVLISGSGLSGTSIASRSYLQDGFVAVAYPLVGALIVGRRPHNPVGWVFCGVGVLLAANLFAGALVLSLEAPSVAAEWAGWFETWAWIPAHTLALMVLMLFPTGRFESPRWRAIAVAGLAAGALTVAALALYPDLRSALAEARSGSAPGFSPLELFPDFRAVGASGLGTPVGLDANGALELLGFAGALVVLLVTIAAPVSLVRRLRRARGEERQQLAWMAYAGVLLAAGASLTIPLDGQGILAALIQALVLGPIVALAAGFAMLRHRLYDIHVVINRTLVYGALTATLAGAYLGTVLLLQLALSPLTEQSDLAIAGSTLAVAALFRPARAAIQQAVDRRFYRRRYDAALALEHFGARLRDEVELGSLDRELRGVLAETMQPAHVSLWVRAP
jgi:hypothetical protein